MRAADRTVRSRGGIRRLLRDLTTFGVVGAAGLVVDLGGFNLLWYGGHGAGILHDRPLTARAISVVAATLLTYAGNRHWTWRDREWRRFHHEYALFFALNAAGLAINLAVLAFVNYGLGLRDDALANNLANVAGVGCGTVFRFWSYGRFVFVRRSRVGPAPARPGRVPGLSPRPITGPITGPMAVAAQREEAGGASSSAPNSSSVMRR